MLVESVIWCAEQRVDQEGSSPSGARMRSAISKSGGNSSLAGKSRRYGEAYTGTGGCTEKNTLRPDWDWHSARKPSSGMAVEYGIEAWSGSYILFHSSRCRLSARHFAPTQTADLLNGMQPAKTRDRGKFRIRV